MAAGDRAKHDKRVRQVFERIPKSILSALPACDEGTAVAGKIDQIIIYQDLNVEAVKIHKQDIRKKSEEKINHWKERYKCLIKNNSHLSKRDAGKIIEKEGKDTGKFKGTWDYIRKYL